MINSLLILLVGILLISLDKIITALHLLDVRKKYRTRWITVEKNPLARWFFKKFGLLFGSISYGIVSLFSFIVSGALISSIPILFNKNIDLLFGFGIVSVLYILAILNNLYWYFKWKKN